MVSLCRRSPSGRRQVDGDRARRHVGLDPARRDRTAPPAACTGEHRRWREYSLGRPTAGGQSRPATQETLHRGPEVGGPDGPPVGVPQPRPQREDVGLAVGARRRRRRGEGTDERVTGGALDPPVADEAVVGQRVELRRRRGRVGEPVQRVEHDRRPRRVREAHTQRPTPVRALRGIGRDPHRAAGDGDRRRAAPGHEPLRPARPVRVDAGDGALLPARHPHGALAHRHRGRVAGRPRRTTRPSSSRGRSARASRRGG